MWLRPEQSGVGRPARRSRAELTVAAVHVADREGLDAVTMRRVAAELDTGAGSLYRYVENREELLDLMADHVAGEYRFAEPTGDWVADLVDVGLQARDIHRRHPWLPDRTLTAPGVGPNAVDLVEHYLTVLDGHPADDATKLVAIGAVNALVAAVARSEQSTVRVERNAEYLAHVAASGTHPHLSALSAPPLGGTDPLPAIIRGVLVGLLPA
ncbi:MAG TPA: TetR/AcrR family transcriptional regulator [Lapillicoccus sp.]|uniref:TetR/AcrR family transcriptional regulator n=1 Tax=Lapillicoccus sp. TaxID=1909287 RepID=UPI002F93EC45